MNFDIDKLLDLLKEGILLKENEVKILCAKVREIFVEESNVQRIDAPVTVILFPWIYLFFCFFLFSVEFFPFFS